MLGSVVIQIDSAVIWNDKKSVLNVAVIGAGPAGLSHPKHALDYGHNVKVYELNEEIGVFNIQTAQKRICHSQKL